MALYDLYTLKEIHEKYDLPRDYFKSIDRRLTDKYLRAINFNMFDMLWFKIHNKLPGYTITKSGIFEHHIVYVNILKINRYL